MSDKKLAKTIEDALLSREKIYPGAASYYFDAKKIDTEQLNRLRTVLMDEMETVAFDELISNKNTAFDDDETIMSYLDFVLLDDREVSDKNFEKIRKKGAKFTLKKKGDIMVNSSDIKETDQSYGLKVVGGYPLFWLRENETINLEIIAKISTGSDSEKFRLVNVVYVEGNAAEGQHKLTIESSGIYQAQQIYDMAMDTLRG